MSRPNALIHKGIRGQMWDNGCSEAARSCRSKRPLTHLIDSTDRQDEMNATTPTPMRECRLCHRIGERLFMSAEGGVWECTNIQTCARRRGERLPPDERAYDRLLVSLKPEGDCIIFTGSLTEHGYGRMHVAGRPMKAHRLAWIIQNGPIPAGLHVLHHCDNPPCCNPEHLFLGTHSDNMADMKSKGRATGEYQKAKTHCPNGHPYSGDNLVINCGKRVCRICRRASDARVRERRRVAREAK